MSTNKSSRFTPIIIAVSIVVGILIGTFYTKHYSGSRLGIINSSSNKLNALLRIIDDQYVDTVNMAFARCYPNLRVRFAYNVSRCVSVHLLDPNVTGDTAMPVAKILEIGRASCRERV